jgi:DNA-binding MarR family transcriptional regulator
MAANNLNKIISLIFLTRQQVFKEITFAKKPLFSFVQLLTIQFIKERRKTTMKEVAGFLNITPPSATSLINILVKNGVLARREGVGDRRIVWLKITPKGEKILKRGYAQIAGKIKETLSCLSEKEQKALIHILEKIANQKKLKN